MKAPRQGASGSKVVETETAVPALPDSGTPSEEVVQVWTWTVSSEPWQSGEDSYLDPHEIARAARIRSRAARTQWIRCHARVREILGRALAFTPSGLILDRTPEGRPFVRGRPHVDFSFSHSADRCALALVRNARVGIDLEVDRKVVRLVWKRVLAPAELDALHALPAEDQDAAFLQCWTRKEALAKADGRGVGAIMNRVSVGLRGGTDAEEVLLTDAAGDPTKWYLRDLHLAQGCAALCTSAELPVRMWHVVP